MEYYRNKQKAIPIHANIETARIYGQKYNPTVSQAMIF